VGVDLVDGDLGTPEGRAALVAAAPEGLQGVVTCAGLAGLTGRPPEPVVSVNYFGTVDLLTGLRPKLAPGASVVAISSNSATVYPGWDSEVVDACLSGDEPLARELSARRDSTAAYAASKAAVARWVRRAKQKDPGVFTSEVGFDETKAYVQKVMNNYRVYKQLYTADLVRK